MGGLVAAARVMGRAAAGQVAGMSTRRPAMRLGVHPGDVTVPALLTSIDKTLGALTKGGRFAQYRELLETH